MPNENTRPGGDATALNLSVATVVKASPGTVYRVSVNTASTTTGSAGVSYIYDTATLASVATSNVIAIVPAETVETVDLTWPCLNGITFVPGTGAVASISFQ